MLPDMSDPARNTEIGTVVRRHAPPKRQKNAKIRPREYLTQADRSIDEGSAQAGALGVSQRDHDPRCLPPWAPGRRAGVVALGPGGFRHCTSARQPAEARAREPASAVWSGTSGVAPAEARTDAGITVRIPQ